MSIIAFLISSSERIIKSFTKFLQISKVMAPFSIQPALPSDIVGINYFSIIFPAFMDSYITAEFSG